MTPMDRLHDTQDLSRSRKLLAGVFTFWMTLLFSHGVQAAGEVLADPNATVRPGIGTQNNVPIVNIVAPDAQGLSHNRYLQFNIPAQGLVFNNSLQAGTSGLAGDLGANPHFNGQAASLILNEVTGFNPSQLLGRGEVFGSAARLIIANPNGIYASGAGFLNTPRVTLTTGTPQFSGGTLTGFAIGGGAITLDGAPIDVRGVATTDLVARNLLLNGALVSDGEARLYAGQGVWRYSDGQLSPSASTGNGSLAIDASHLGAISAGRIFIIANEQGAGVRLDGRLSATAGNINITSSGEIRLSNAHASDTIDLRAKDNLVLQGELLARRDVLLSGKDVLVDSTASLAAANRLVARASSNLVNLGEMAAGVEQALLADQGIVNAGTAYSAGSLNVQSDSVLNVGRFLAEGALFLNTFRGDLQNEGLLYAGDRLYATGGAALINLNDGLLFSGAEMRLQAIDAVVNWGQQSAAGDILIRANTYDDYGRTQSAGSLNVHARDIRLSDSQLTATQDIVLTEAVHVGLFGNASLEAGRDAIIISNVLDNPGVIQAGRHVEIGAGEISNSGSVLAGAVLRATSQQLRNDGVLNGDGIAMDAEQLENQGLILANSSLQISIEQGHGVISNQGGKIISLGSALLAADTIDNRSGEIAAFGNLGVVAGTNDSIGAALLNAQGVVFSGQQMVMDVRGDIDNRDGLMHAEGDLSLTLRGIETRLLTTDGRLHVAGNTLIDQDGYFYAGRASEYYFGGDLEIRAASYTQVASEIINVGGDLRLAIDLHPNAPWWSSDGLISAPKFDVAGNIVIQASRIGYPENLHQDLFGALPPGYEVYYPPYDSRIALRAGGSITLSADLIDAGYSYLTADAYAPGMTHEDYLAAASLRADWLPSYLLAGHDVVVEYGNRFNWSQSDIVANHNIRLRRMPGFESAHDDGVTLGAGRADARMADALDADTAWYQRWWASGFNCVLSCLVVAGNDIRIDAPLTLNGATIEAGRDLYLFGNFNSASEEVTNAPPQHPLASGFVGAWRDLYIDADTVDNRDRIGSGRHLSVLATQVENVGAQSAILAGAELVIQAEHIQNEGTIQGGSVYLAANTITNTMVAMPGGNAGGAAPVIHAPTLNAAPGGVILPEGIAADAGALALAGMVPGGITLPPYVPNFTGGSDGSAGGGSGEGGGGGNGGGTGGNSLPPEFVSTGDPIRDAALLARLSALSRQEQQIASGAEREAPRVNLPFSLGSAAASVATPSAGLMGVNAQLALRSGTIAGNDVVILANERLQNQGSLLANQSLTLAGGQLLISSHATVAAGNLAIQADQAFFHNKVDVAGNVVAQTGKLSLAEINAGGTLWIDSVDVILGRTHVGLADISASNDLILWQGATATQGLYLSAGNLLSASGALSTTGIANLSADQLTAMSVHADQGLYLSAEQRLSLSSANTGGDALMQGQYLSVQQVNASNALLAGGNVNVGGLTVAGTARLDAKEDASLEGKVSAGQLAVLSEGGANIAGATIAAENVELQARYGVQSAGSTLAASNVYMDMGLQGITSLPTGWSVTGVLTAKTAGDIRLTDTRFKTEGALNLLADGDLDLYGVKLSAHDLSLSAGGNMVWALSPNLPAWQQGKTVEEQFAQYQTELVAECELRAAAGGALTIESAKASAGCNSGLSAGAGLVIGSMEFERFNAWRVSKNGKANQTDVHQLGSTLSAGGHLALSSGADLAVQGSALNAGGNIQLLAEGDTTLASALESREYHYLYKKKDWKGKKTVKTEDTYEVTHQATTLNAGGDLLVNVGRDADGGLVAGATGDVTSLGAKITTGGESIIYGQNVDLLAVKNQLDSKKTKSSSSWYSGSKKTTSTSMLESLKGSALIAGTDASLMARDDITVVASKVAATGDVALKTDGNISLVAGINTHQLIEEINKENFATFSNTQRGFIRQEAVESEIIAGRDVALEAAADIHLTASRLVAENNLRIGGEVADAKSLDNGEGVYPSNVIIDTVALTNKSWNETQKGLKGPLAEIAKAMSVMFRPMIDIFTLGQYKPSIEIASQSKTSMEKSTAPGSVIASDALQISATDKVSLVNADLIASGKAQIDASDIEISAIAEKETFTHTESTQTVSGLGMKLGKDELRIAGVEMVKNSQSEQSTLIEWNGSTITAEELVLKARHDLSILASALNVSGDATLSAGNGIIIGGAENRSSKEYQEVTEVTTLSASVRNAYVDAALSVKAFAEAADAVKDAKRALDDAERRADAGELSKDDLKYYRTNLAAATANLVQMEIAMAAALAQGAASAGTGFYVSGAAQHEKTTLTSSDAQTHWQGTTIAIGGNASLASGNQLKVQGSEIDVEGGLSIDAKDIALMAGEERMSSSTQTSRESGGITLSSKGVGSGGLNVGEQSSDSSLQSLHYVNTNIQAGSISSSSDSLRLSGAVIEAGQVSIDTGSLSVISMQDRSEGVSSSEGGSLGLGAGSSGITSGSAAVNTSQTESERRWVAEQSAIVGHEGISISANDTELVGAVIANATRDESGAWVDQGQLQLHTETLTVTHLQDVDRSKTVGGNMAISVPVGGNRSSAPTSNAPAGNTSTGAAQQVAQGGVPLDTLTIGGINTSHVIERTSQATLGAGQVTIGETQGGTINRDLSAAQLVTRDQATGGLDASMTIDGRWFDEGGRKEMAEQQKKIASNWQVVASQMESDIQMISVDVLDYLPGRLSDGLKMLDFTSLGLLPFDKDDNGSLLTQLPVLLGFNSVHQKQLLIADKNNPFALENPHLFHDAENMPGHAGMAAEGKKALEGKLVSIESIQAGVTFQNFTNGMYNTMAEAAVNGFEQTGSGIFTLNYNPRQGFLADVLEIGIDKAGVMVSELFEPVSRVTGINIGFASGVAHETGRFMADVMRQRGEDGASFIAHSQGNLLMQSGLWQTSLEGITMTHVIENENGYRKRENNFYVGMNGSPVNNLAMAKLLENKKITFASSVSNSGDFVSGAFGGNVGVYTYNGVSGESDIKLTIRPFYAPDRWLDSGSPLKLMDDKYGSNISPHSSYGCALICGDTAPWRR